MRPLSAFYDGSFSSKFEYGRTDDKTWVIGAFFENALKMQLVTMDYFFESKREVGGHNKTTYFSG